MSNLNDEFESAVTASKALPKRPGNDVLLELYGFFKQATSGDATGERPGPFDFVGRAKFDAWTARKGMSQEAAMQAYVALVARLQEV